MVAVGSTAATSLWIFGGKDTRLVEAFLSQNNRLEIGRWVISRSRMFFVIFGLNGVGRGMPKPCDSG